MTSSGSQPRTAAVSGDLGHHMAQSTVSPVSVHTTLSPAFAKWASQPFLGTMSTMPMESRKATASSMRSLRITGAALL